MVLIPLLLLVALQADELPTTERSALPSGSGVTIPPGRPAWVEAPAWREGDTWFVPVASGPYSTRAEAEEALDQALLETVARRVVELTGDPSAGSQVTYPAQQARREFLHRPAAGDLALYREQIVVSVGPMHQTQALLAFTPEHDTHLQRRWREVVVQSRLWGVGAGTLALLAALGLAAYLLRR